MLGVGLSIPEVAVRRAGTPNGGSTGDGAGPHTPAILLEDGTSYLLMEDGSYLLLE